MWPHDSHPRVLVQGITGREAGFWTERMLSCGTAVVAGVTPGKAGQVVHGVPVYDAVAPARDRHAADTAVLFVPPRAARAAAMEALVSGIRSVVILTEHVPVHDVMAILAEARERGARVLGPNSPGLVKPGRYFIGILPAWARTIFRPGRIGVASRSGSLGTLVCLNLVREGLGQSAFVGIGGDPIVGTSFREALSAFEADPDTESIVLLGEVGGVMEEDAAELIPRMTKPVVAFIGGRSAPEGKRMGHAGAIVSGEKGRAGTKVDRLRQAGARIADVPSQIGPLLKR